MLQLPACGCGVPECWGREKRRCRGLKPYAPPLLWLIARRCQVVGSEERPRLAVFRSNQHIYAQVCGRAEAQAARRAGHTGCRRPGRGLLLKPLSPRACPQVIDDSKNVTLVGMGSVSKAVREALGEDGEKKSATKSKDAAAMVGRLLAEKCKEKGIEMVVFDRGGFKYHGRISVRTPLRVHRTGARSH